jgi:hypothetical protein
LIERVLPTGPASTPDPVPAWMAGAGSGVIPRKATLEPPVLPANRRSRRQPPGRTRDSIPLSENHAPIPPPDSGAGPACERQRPEPRSCQPLPRRRTRSLRRSNRPLLRCAGPPRDTGRRCRSPLANAVVRAADSARLDPWPNARAVSPMRAMASSPKRSSCGGAPGVQSDRPRHSRCRAVEQGTARRPAISARVGACWSSADRPRPARRS